LPAYVGVILLIFIFNSNNPSQDTRSVAADSLYLIGIFLLATSALVQRGGLIGSLVWALHNALQQSVADRPIPGIARVIRYIAEFLKYEYAAYGLIALAFLTTKRDRLPERSLFKPLWVQFTLVLVSFVALVYTLIIAISGIVREDYLQFASSLMMTCFSFAIFWIGVNAFRGSEAP